MKKIIWIFRAAWYMRGVFGYWSPRNLAFCWETASVLWHNHIYDNTTPGDPVEEIWEELSCWGD